MTDDELYRIAKERAEGKRPNVPWRKDETDEQRRERWNAANPQDPIPCRHCQQSSGHLPYCVAGEPMPPVVLSL